VVFIDYPHMRDVFIKILIKQGLSPRKAELCAAVLADNTLDGINRFKRFAERIRTGQMNKDAEPVKTGGFAAFEQWDGGGGIGPVNGLGMMERAMALADTYGAGFVALRNTTHWMRGATYAYRAVSEGYPCFCMTNTNANMAPWPSSVETIGNNPVVFGMPGADAPVVLDMALSQYSYGKLQTMAAAGETLDFDGGFDADGNLTKDPAALLESRRMLPVGLWKGSGLSIMTDLFVSVLSGGASAVDIENEDSGVCQLFAAIHPGKSPEEKTRRNAYTAHVLATIKENCAKRGESARYPGEGTAKRRAEQLKTGMPVREEVWRAILGML
jgi:3-dehydro-L-gulonate 2-dehydrogenase